MIGTIKLICVFCGNKTGFVRPGHKEAVLSKITVSQVCLKVFPCNFLLNSGESHVTVTSFTHVHSGLL